MSTFTIVMLVILIVLIVACVVLYFLGKRAEKKQAEQQEQSIDAGRHRQGDAVFYQFGHSGDCGNNSGLFQILHCFLFSFSGKFAPLRGARGGL